MSAPPSTTTSDRDTRPVDESRYRRRSMWLDLIDEPLQPRDPLPGSVGADVAIVGAGYTALWTAYYLA